MAQGRIWTIVAALTVASALAGCVGNKSDLDGMAVAIEELPRINAYYQGEEIWFIHTDVSSKDMAERLSSMVGHETVYAPANREAVDLTKLGKLYVFTNGISHAEDHPWGGGPFGFQIDVFDSVPGQASYTSIRQPVLVTWGDTAAPRDLTSVQEIQGAQALGELDLQPVDVVVNVPVVRWPNQEMSMMR